MTATIKCSAKIYSGFYAHQCNNTGKYEHNGKHFCKTHNPLSVQEKKSLRDAEFKLKHESFRKKHFLISAAPELLEACEALCHDELTGEQFAMRLAFAKKAIAKAKGEQK